MTTKATEYVRALIPMLVCRDGFAEIAFISRCFGATELSRRVDEGLLMHATLSIGESLLMVHGVTSHLASRPPDDDGSSSVVLYLYLDDGDSTVARAVNAGAKVLTEVQNLPWGNRMGRVLDPEGHVWNVSSRPKA